MSSSRQGISNRETVEEENAERREHPRSTPESHKVGGAFGREPAEPRREGEE